MGNISNIKLKINYGKQSANFNKRFVFALLGKFLILRNGVV
jgi:hypothetical protein